MTPTDLDRIEKVLGVSLPDVYRSTMQSYPFDSDDFPYGCMLPDNAEWVINANRGPDTHFMLHHRKGRWVPSRDHLLIGTDGGEEYYYIDLQRDPPPVMRFDLESGELSMFCDNLNRYLSMCRGVDAKIAEGERQATEGGTKQKWWQFWKH
jgi:hypothetical protein